MNSPETFKLLWSANNGVRPTSSQQQQQQQQSSPSPPPQATTTTTTANPHSINYITLGYRQIAALVTVAMLVGFALAAELNDNSSFHNTTTPHAERSATGCSTTFAFRGNHKNDLVNREHEDDNGNHHKNNNIHNNHNNQNQGLAVFANHGMKKEDTTTTTTQEKDDNEDPYSSSSFPRLAWLMSFPNSGTSFTLKMIRHVSQRVTASNYGEENRDDYGNSVPVYPNHTDGPFWLEPQRISKGYTFPTAFALTKTHCGGRCEKCGPSNYIENPHSFLTQCRSGKRVDTDKNGERTYVDVQYDANLVRKAVHLIRNPFDNIVSRFHLEYHGYMKRNETQKQTLFPNSKEGFRNFCHYLDLKFQVEETHSRFVESHIRKAMQSVPCHGDFFRYVQWHNLAFVTTLDLTVPTYVLHYENYEENFNQTVTGLLNFLQLDWEKEAPEFIKGKEYSEYFTAEEQKIVRTAMEALSSTTTWNNIHHYFD